MTAYQLHPESAITMFTSVLFLSSSFLIEFFDSRL
jgi:hypothetical protein